MTRNSTLLILLSLAFLSLATISCKKFEGGQTTPSFIHIDSVSVSGDYFVYGATTHKITDAWVYVDDQLVGVYELPSTFPILKKGPHKVSVYGGIKVDGRSTVRNTYPFYKPLVYERLNLVEDSIINLQPVLNYYPIGDGVNFAWSEDFENTNTLLKDLGSDTSAIRITGPEAWHSVNSYWSGKVELPPDSLDFTLVNSEELDFYSDFPNGVYCMLEMDYNCNDTFFVGVQYYKQYQLVKWPLVKVTPTDKTHDKPQKWNKIYINIGPTINQNYTASYFKIYFTSDLTTEYDLWHGYEYHPISEPRYYYFDNLKLLYRPL